jgi:hypothetical protein
MKKFVALFLITISASSFASEKRVLSCTTAADALSSAEIIETNSKTRYLRVNYMNDEVKNYKLDRNLKNIKVGVSDTFVGTTSESSDFGGAISDAILLRFFDGAKTARLGMDGSVYFLNCTK